MRDDADGSEPDSSSDTSEGEATASTTSASRPVLHLSLAGLLAGTIGFAFLGSDGTGGATLGLYAALFVPYGAVAWRTWHDETIEATDLWLIVATAVLARLTLLFAEPVLSDDVFRYVWDGRVGLSGINPFRYAPADEALAHLRDDAVWPAVNHPEVPTIYPPGAQYLFQLNALLGGGVVGIKALFVGIEGVCIGLSWRLLATGESAWGRARLTWAFVLYALNPLVVVEGARSGHLDLAAWSLLTLGFVLWTRRRNWVATLGAGAALGASIAVKFLGLALLPLLWTGRLEESPPLRPLRHRIAVVAVAPLIAMATYTPFLGAGSDLFAGFGTYAQKWRGNDGAYRVVYRTSREALRRWGGSDDASTDDATVLFRFQRHDELFEDLGWTKRWRGRTIPDTTFTAGRLASLIAKGCAGLVVLLVLSFCMATRMDPMRSALWVLLALYVFAPIVHPWYVAWLIPLAALRPNWSAFTFSATVLAAYLAWLSARQGGTWHVPDWAVALEYGAVVAASVVDVARHD